MEREILQVVATNNFDHNNAGETKSVCTHTLDCKSWQRFWRDLNKHRSQTHTHTHVYIYVQHVHTLLHIPVCLCSWRGGVGWEGMYRVWMDGWLDGLSGREIRSSRSLAIKSSL